ncbi:Chlorophyll A-B binding protein [Musa troglodytarum]|uniref:Chlorophyll A-B binding protein n=1 Tax=Musa troglodytarum TaxID=320322 RepID=A0A9E7JT06_9LILI|nr:Chlorophyll A-B binding protein [Musa troglodytarum]
MALATASFALCNPQPNLPGDFGSNPVGLGSDPEMLLWFAQAKLKYSAGILIPACLKKSLALHKNAHSIFLRNQQYFADPVTLFKDQHCNIFLDQSKLSRNWDVAITTQIKTRSVLCPVNEQTPEWLNRDYF